MTSSAWSPVERLDAARIAAELEEQTGVPLVVERLGAGGQVGAAVVRWPDGHRSILKWRPDVRLPDLEAGPLAVTEAARVAGLPAPRTELAVQLGTAIATVQELLPGAPIRRLDDHGLTQALDFNSLHAGLLRDRPDVPAFELFLDHDGPGFCLHGPLRAHNRRTARIDDWVREVGTAYPTLLEGVDAVHSDYHPGNLLAVDGTITGIIDWDGASRGDRRFDLVTLRFGAHGEPPLGRVTPRLDAILDAVPADVLRPLWAVMSLRMVDWAIRHFTPAAVEHWADLAEQRID
ncbi:aminoglycoside phosphotransferase family protein [Kribbella capetownensis]|uniref:Aminoglycoside phosphotransferase family protein n=1 Tax=Kribbella capetownensis TaxID=1572659 RepID=A0A4R0JR77_9ACTN|nr:phosphotransferase [Kribbella capetownensis]TCC47566.1 aminoglycoside phosphotransferase family protein [Kribbella capetownensis]